MAKITLTQFETSLGNIGNIILSLVVNAKILGDNASGVVSSSPHLLICLLEHTIGKLWALRADKDDRTISFNNFGILTSKSQFLRTADVKLDQIVEWRNNLSYHINNKAFDYLDPNWTIKFGMKPGQLQTIVDETADLFLEMCRFFGNVSVESDFTAQLRMIRNTVTIRVTEEWVFPNGSVGTKPE